MPTGTQLFGSQYDHMFDEALLLKRHGRYEDSITKYKQLCETLLRIDQRRNVDQIYYALGKVQFLRGRYKSAIASYKLSLFFIYMDKFPELLDYICHEKTTNITREMFISEMILESKHIGYAQKALSLVGGINAFDEDMKAYANSIAGIDDSPSEMSDIMMINSGIETSEKWLREIFTPVAQNSDELNRKINEVHNLAVLTSDAERMTYMNELKARQRTSQPTQTTTNKPTQAAAQASGCLLPILGIMLLLFLL